MGFLRVVSIKPPIQLSKSQNAKFCTKAIKGSELNTVNMSFTSYESTHTVASGGPPPLLVMHGLFGSKRNWNSICKVFQQKTSPQRKVIAVDARNHGDSPHCSNHTYPHLAEDIKALLMQLKIKKVALLGHSMGGRAVMYFALKYPKLVDKLIIGDISPVTTSPNLTSMPGIFKAVQKVNLPNNVPMSAARLTCDIQLSETINDKGLRAFLLTNLAQSSDGSYMWRINIPSLLNNFSEHIARFPDVTDYKFTGPALFVSGGASDFVQKTDHSQILKIFPNAEFQEIADAGHWVHNEKPNEFLQICIEFLNKKTTES